jgi:hypothetical protein
MPDPTPPPAGNLKDQVTLLLINGTPVDAVVGFCFQRGLDPDAAKGVVAEARKRITVAADYTRDEQVALAFTRFNDIYGKSMAVKDHRTALAAQKELNRLLGLNSPARDAVGGDEDIVTVRRQVELMASYLIPLGLVPDTYPVEEHARVAAEIIRSNDLANLRTEENQG